MARCHPSLAGWSRWLRLFQVVAMTLVWVLFWSFRWAILGLMMGLVVVMSGAHRWLQAFQPWSLTSLPPWIMAGGFVGGWLVGFIWAIRDVLGEVRRTLFFAEVQEMAEQIMAETDVKRPAIAGDDEIAF